MHKLGFIGGSGLYSLKDIEIVSEHAIETPFGEPSDNYVLAKCKGLEVIFLPRHGRNHSYLPSEVNYLANIYGFKKLGVTSLVSVSAVGSLCEDLAPGDFFCPDQFIDWTKGLRKRTFFGDGLVGHVSTAKPVDIDLMNLILKAGIAAGVVLKSSGSYICIEGPQFSSKAESAIYRNLGAKVIGMTNIPEAYLAKEAGVAYSTIAMVTDFDCWKDEHCSANEIMKVMKENNAKAQVLIPKIVELYSKNKIKPVKENKEGIMTPESAQSDEHKRLLKVLLS